MNKPASYMSLTFSQIMKLGALNFILLPVAFTILMIWPGFKPDVAAAGGPVVWLVDNMQRIKPDAPAGNARHIELYAARGEYEPFQIIIRAPRGQLENVNVVKRDLVGSDGSIISKANITLYREHYIYLTRGSKSGKLLASNKPSGKGWYPEPLIPFRDPQTGVDISGAELDAVPFDLPKGRNQPIWVEVFVPRSAKAGNYKGTFQVISAQGNVEVKLTLNVWNFGIPLKPSLTAIGILRNADAMKDFGEVLKHKFNPYQIGNKAEERELIDRFGLKAVNVGYWTGNDYGNCTPMPAPPSVADIKKRVNQHQPDLLLYAHYADEIGACPNIFSGAVRWAERLRQGGIKPLLTGTPGPDLMDADGNSAADIWSILPVEHARENNLKYIEEARERGEFIWTTSAIIEDGYTPKWGLDFAPINLRIHAGFLSQTLNITGLEYWSLDYWSADPWNDVSRYDAREPGNGVLVYPGDTVGTSGVIGGMRLKWLREGIEDYEYVEILKSLGKEDFAIKVTKTVAPDWKKWTRSTDALFAARRKLGEEIHRLSKP